MKVIVNTGPLVFLSKINRLHILQKFGNIAAPKGVIAEINIKQDIVAASVSKSLSGWLKVKTVKDKALLNGLNVIGTLGLLAWAKKKGYIKSFRGEVLKLQKAGFYATAELTEKLAKEIGEN